jgi:hypothetical protein
MDVTGNMLAMSFGSGACGGPLMNLIWGLYYNSGGVPASSNTYNMYIRVRNNVILHNGNPPMLIMNPLPGQTIDIEDNVIYTNYMVNQLIQVGNNTSGGLVKFINNTVYWGGTPSSSTSYYLVYQPWTGSGPYYIPNVIMKGNKFNFPTSNAAFGGFVGNAGVAPANPSALFVDLDNSFNLSGVNLPYPSVTTPAVPASGTAQSNTYPYPVEVYVSGGSATAVQVTRGGVTYTVWSSSTATAIPPLLVRLEPGDSISITYSTAPSWTWVPAKYIG